jgi:hypothetical protein
LFLVSQFENRAISMGVGQKRVKVDQERVSRCLGLRMMSCGAETM